MKPRYFGPFWPDQELKDEWLDMNIKVLPSPNDLQQRNLLQMFLTKRYVAVFKTEPIEALQHVAKKYREHFPH